ncbi:hypothetical protein CYMTET_6240 [Cymbomonas tetramitiformis]|uniref:Uncharacterized protein n=1 Tax=Cymbomonas tetramitiformis TaxID=36881 RepID=A0AAE0GXL5_9CHLO|nr:hypothetical protein CYMTET_6240 [Cymbomonas tetramitiformis]
MEEHVSMSRKMRIYILICRQEYGEQGVMMFKLLTQTCESRRSYVVLLKTEFCVAGIAHPGYNYAACPGQNMRAPVWVISESVNMCYRRGL